MIRRSNLTWRSESSSVLQGVNKKKPLKRFTFDFVRGNRHTYPNNSELFHKQAALIAYMEREAYRNMLRYTLRGTFKDYKEGLPNE